MSLLTFSAPDSDRAADENFPVASLLIRAELRPVVAAYYRLARAADDIADDRALDAAEKSRRLAALDVILAGHADGADDDPPQRAARRLREEFAGRGLAIEHARHLLQAFQADAVNRPTRNWSDLLTYCRFSAAPVGRFLLDLHGEARAAWPAADALCAALQILNHIQDCRADWRDLQRSYLPEDWLADAGAAPKDVLGPNAAPALQRVIDQMLDGVDRLIATAKLLPAQIGNSGLRREAVAILTLARLLAWRLRRRDPVTRRVRLWAVEKVLALIYGFVRGTWR